MSTGNSNGFVRCMRSHDYNQFEVCLPLPPGTELMKHDIAISIADEIRKDAARLVDKAVHQYDQMKAAPSLAARLANDGGELSTDTKNAYDEAMQIPPEQWTNRQRVAVKLTRDKDWLDRQPQGYDYEDDAPEFEDPAF